MAFLGVYRAIYNYEAQNNEELEIREGDLLFVLEKGTEDDWWKCRKKASSDDEDEPEGLVPNNYVEQVHPTHKAKALYDYTKQTDEELSFKEDVQLDVYDDSDPDWTLVGYNGEYGFAPTIYIETAASTGAAAPARELAAPPPPMPPRPPTDDEPLPGEADYIPPRPTSVEKVANNPAAQLAGIIAQKTGGGSTGRDLASPPPTRRVQFTPDESEEEEAPSLPRRPVSTEVSSPPPAPPLPQAAPPRHHSPPGVVASPPYNRAVSRGYEDQEEDDGLRSPGGFHLYNVHEMISHMGKSKKMPTTLGLNIAKGVIMISPEKSKDGPSKEWTADKLAHYSIEGKHVFVELVRPSKSVDFHAGAKDTAQEIVAALGEIAGAVRQEGLREVLAASAGTGSGGLKTGQMLYEFMAQGEDEVTVAVGDEVVILDDTKSDEWWMIRRLKTGKEGVVPCSYVEITGTVKSEAISGLNTARSTVEQNRLEEERLAREAAKKQNGESGLSVAPPERGSSLTSDSVRSSSRNGEKRSSKDQAKSKPNQSRVRTWTDRSGSFKVDAEFIGLRDGKIHLHKLNGVKIAVPVAKMAVEDLEYVERATGASLDEDKPLSDIKRRSTLRLKDKDTAGASIQKKEEYDWFDFFLQCGVNPQICERYAMAFSRDQMGTEILPEVNEQLLRTLGLKEGDILRVMKFLDSKYDRKKGTGAAQEEGGSGSAGGLFSGLGGAIKNNTRKGRPAPAIQTNDTIDESAFKQNDESASPKDLPADAQPTPLATAPPRKPKSGFDDEAWDVKPSRTQSPAASEAASKPPAAPITVPAPPKPKVNDDIAQLAITSPALEPTRAPQPAPSQPANTTTTQIPPAPQPPLADQAIFDKIAALAPKPPQLQPQPTAYQPQMMQSMQTGYQQPQMLQSQQTAMPRQRPAPPPLQYNSGVLPPPRSASAPGYPPNQTMFGPTPLQPQLTGYQPNVAPPGQSLQELQNQQQYQHLQPQPTAFQGPQGFVPGIQQPNGFPPQTAIQSLQQNYPSLQPQPTGFQPQSQFGQQQAQQYGIGQPNYQQQQMVNSQQTGSPFADPPRQPFQPTPSPLSTAFSAQQTGFQPSFNISQPTGMNGYGTQQVPPVPQLPPQQTGGVFGPSQPAGFQTPVAPLVAQKTGPTPPVRFGVQPGAKPLVPQPTGRANLAKATPQNPFGF